MYVLNLEIEETALIKFDQQISTQKNGGICFLSEDSKMSRDLKKIYLKHNLK